MNFFLTFRLTLYFCKRILVNKQRVLPVGSFFTRIVRNFILGRVLHMSDEGKAAADSNNQKRRVRVLFGTTAIADQTLPGPEAVEYEQAMRRRFASLRVTNDLVAEDPSSED
jgi:hypothetical protein